LPRLLPGVHTHVTASFVASPQSVRALAAPVRAGIEVSFVHSLHTVFLVGIPVAAAAFVLAILLPDLPLRQHAYIGQDEPALEGTEATVPDKRPSLEVEPVG
jgi:hypothetical protein